MMKIWNALLNSSTYKVFLLVAGLCLFSGVKAQNTSRFEEDDKESLEYSTEERFKPGKAALWSTVLPGAGQIYNRSYWKAPLVWGGLATFSILAVYNHNQAILYQEELDYRDANNDMPNDQDLSRFSEQSLERARDQSIRYRDLNIILGLLWYGLNIADAYVDAHLKGFEVTDNLALGISPELYSNGTQFQPGLSLGLRFKP